MLGNDESCKVKGIGSVKIKMFDGKLRILTNARYVPELKINLISLGTLNASGYEFNTERGQIHVTKSENIVMKGEKNNVLYILIGETIVGKADVVMSNQDTIMWHKRLGHIGERGLKELSSKGVFGGKGVSKLDFCEQCVLGKDRKHSYGKGSDTTKEPLDYVHSDIWEPSRVETHGGGRFFMTIIDDFSRRVWVFILKHKNDAFSKFKEWLLEQENKKHKVLKHLRTDNGLEYLSEEFQSFCKLKGITSHRTIPANPQPNGLAERMNRTILEKVRCMLSDAKLPKSFWGETVNTACFLINKSPSTAIN